MAVLDRLRRARGTPVVLPCDDGSEFTRHVVDLWAYQHGVRIDYSRPGKPTDNAFFESFNGTFRDECLNVHWLESLEDAIRVVEAWRVEYESRPHRALGEVPPAEYARRFKVQVLSTDRSIVEATHIALGTENENRSQPGLC